MSLLVLRKPCCNHLLDLTEHRTCVFLLLSQNCCLCAISTSKFIKLWNALWYRFFNPVNLICYTYSPSLLYFDITEQNRVLSSNDVTGDVDEAGDSFVQNGKVAKEKSQNFSKGKKKKVFKVVDDHRSFNKRQTASDVPEVKKQKSSHSKGANNKNMSSQKDTKRRKKVFKKSVKTPNYSNKWFFLASWYDASFFVCFLIKMKDNNGVRL